LSCLDISVQDCLEPLFGSIVSFPSAGEKRYFVVVHGSQEDDASQTLGGQSISMGGEFGLLISDRISPEDFTRDPVKECTSGDELLADDLFLEISLLSPTPSNPHADFKGTCGRSSYNNGPAKWYAVVGTGHEFSVTTCDEFTYFDTQITVFSGSCYDMVCVDGTDDSCNGGPLTWNTELGLYYYVLVQGYGRSRVGVFGLELLES
jgi:hypothetical protein